jgi:phosphonate transport system substrate-binding protein
MNMKRMLSGGLLLLILSAAFTYFFYRYSVSIDGVREQTVYGLPGDSLLNNKEVVYISVISRYPPNIIYRGYQPLLDYLSMQTAYRFELKLCDDYNEAVRLLITKEAAAAFLGSYVYIQAHKEHGVIPILKPLNKNHEPFSRSVLFTSGSNGIFSVNDLKGRSIALPSSESFSTNWFLHSVMTKNNIRRSDLGEISNLPHHQSVIDRVLRGSSDAGVTREHLITKLKNKNVRILMYSDPFPSSPIVVAKDYSRPIVEAISSALLNVERSGPAIKQITAGWDNEFIYGFVKATDADYDVIREIRR